MDRDEVQETTAVIYNAPTWYETQTPYLVIGSLFLFFLWLFWPYIEALFEGARVVQ